MTRTKTRHKIIALFFLILFSVETFFPLTAFAITSGPTTPEMSAFEPASTANMVDLFSGDFTYNIPLLDVGGYPVNLSYHSGAGPEEEASWVGFGWSLNPGAINRQLRGLPDDFKGDVMTQYDNKKANVTVGGNINASIKLFGNRLPKIKIGRKKKNLDGNMKVKIGVLHNNYTGYKGVVGIGTGFNTSDDNSDPFTNGLGPSSSTDMSASLGLEASNQSGINPYANFDVNFKVRSQKERAAEKDLLQAQQSHYVRGIINSCFQHKIFNTTESGAKVVQMRKLMNDAGRGSSSFGASSSINFNGLQLPSTIMTPMKSTNFTASLSLGVTLFGGTVSPGIEGSYSKQELKDKMHTAPAYGFMHGHLAKAKEEAVLDYNMEKESPYFKRLPNLGVTVFTPDLFSVTSNAGSMQFRSYLRGSGIYFQPQKKETDNGTNLGLEPAFGNIFHIGVPLQINKTTNTSGKWKQKNSYEGRGDFKSTDAGNPANQASYFKRVGEKNAQDNQYFNAIGNTKPVAVRLSNSAAAWAFGNGEALQTMRIKSQPSDLNANQARIVQDKANHAISFLTAEEAEDFAMQKSIPNYTENTLITQPGAIKNYIPRNSGYRKPHHISQYSITQDDGQRMVYGTPVYNISQQDVSFAIPHSPSQLASGIATYTGTTNSINNMNGKDRYFHKYITPAYTTGHLLTAILSPDYVDVKDDGITDDDHGSAVKFNYSMLSDGFGNPKTYKWRTPYSTVDGNNKTANYNEGFKSIPDDDKGNYTWGEKELWYLHSIESKTMVAQFYTADRNDGLGVVGEDGGKNTATKLQKLTQIRLYSKSDLYNNPSPVPVKIVHFEYYPDDPIMNAMPNHASGKGKLALKKIWFTYGNNDKGKFHSYTFKYNLPANQNYQDNQNDRWGSYRPKSYNLNGLDNLEFPYATQNKATADLLTSFWQLNEIELPSGAIITVQYESDDYSYVQDKKAAQMCFMKGIGGFNSNQDFSRSDKIFVKLPMPVKRPALGPRYFDGLKTLAYKSFVDLDGQNHYEYVSGYADIVDYKLVNASGVIINNDTEASDYVQIRVGLINGKYNPIAKAAWQKLKLDLPRYAYPEYDNLNSEDMGFVSAIKALAATFSRFKDLVESFDTRADRKGFGDKINISKSWVRLNTPSGSRYGPNFIGGKLGGGHRVKEVKINDQWSQMSGVATAENGSYGQRYDYTTVVSGPAGAKDTISSGVASYEPMSGGDENPFHEPINYTDKHLFGLPRYFYLERPMGESYFPGASVGYSKVTVQDLGADGSVGENGSTVNEFYTAKDFPTKVDELPMERRQPKLNFLPRLFGAKITSAVTVSQGYLVENNDMHGKQKAEAVYGKNGKEISSGKYFYKVANPLAEKADLINDALTIDRTGVISSKTVGMDIDLFTEMNESKMENMGVAVDPSFGITWLAVFPKITVKLPLPKPNYEQRLYRGSTTIKLVNRYALLDKVVKTVNGSTNISENMLWDAETGEVLLTKTNNEYEDPIYTFNYPAHWKYDRMGSAFRNEGIYLNSLQTGATGQVQNFTSYLVPGDELIDLGSSRQFWVINANPVETGTPLLVLVDKDGKTQPLVNANVKIMRSGRRNLAMASVGSIVSMNNPIVGSGLSFTQASKILQAKAVEYSEDWHVPIGQTCQPSSCWGVTANSNTAPPLVNLLTPYQSSTLADNYSVYGTRVYVNGYDAQGNSPNFALYNTNYWTNYNLGCATGPLNRTGVWPNTELDYPGYMAMASTSNSTDTTSSEASIPGSPQAMPLPCNNVTETNGRWLGHTFNYTTATQKNLFIGIAGDNNFRFKINGNVVVSRTSGSQDNFRYWNLYPVCLSPGSYTFEFQGYNQGSWGSVGAEVYDNNLSEIEAANADSDLNILFSTRNLVAQNVEVGDGIGYVAPSGYYVYKTGPNNYTAKQINSVAPGGGLPPSLAFNPYRVGLRGNWRTKREHVYDALRTHNKVVPGDPTGTHLRNSGYFQTFDPYNWASVTNQNWQWTAEAKKFNRKGQEIESKDALERFSSAQHGYLESVPVAVGGNAMHREIGFDGFEDYKFSLGTYSFQDSCGIQDHFSFKHNVGSGAIHDNTRSHTGKYSLKLQTTVRMSKPLLVSEPTTMHTISSNEFRLTNNYLRNGFSPVPSKKYIFSGWVYDGVNNSPQITGLSLSINGQSHNVNNNATSPQTYSKVHVVEGWKRFEVVFIMPASGNFVLQMSGSNIWLDDLRVHPYDAVLKSFVYDEFSMRLWAELDENNFATFYEYDDEGTLVRVKKETEKGISTIKETRSSLRKKL